VRIQDERFDKTLAEGRRLLVSAESVVAMSPLLLAARSEGTLVELIVRRVVQFALVLSAILALLIAIGAVPALVGTIVGVWLLMCGGAKLFVKRRRGELGEMMVDLDAGVCRVETLDGQSRSLRLSELSVETSRSADESAPVWVVVRFGRRKFRMGRGAESDAERLLGILRGFHVKVARPK
jgi:hypothetical protein